MRSKIQLEKPHRMPIPANFDIAKYDVCKRWDIQKWYNEIAFRESLARDWQKSTSRMFDAEDVAQIYENYKNHASRLIDKPCNNPPPLSWAKCFISDYTVADLFESLDDERLQNSPWKVQYDSWVKMDVITRYCNDNANEIANKVEKTPTWEMMRDIYGSIRPAIITVDMTGEDEDIKKEFSAWLKTARKKTGVRKPPKTFDQDTFSDWHNDRVLPCFDLLLYKNIYNGDFNLTELNDALYPLAKTAETGNYDESRLRRTVIPNALKVVSAATATALKAELSSHSKEAPAEFIHPVG